MVTRPKGKSYLKPKRIKSLLEKNLTFICEKPISVMLRFKKPFHPRYQSFPRHFLKSLFPENHFDCILIIIVF